jgi:hypothetical protein
VQYDTLTIKKQHFIVTPEELRLLLKDFHHVVVSTGVPKNYIESDPNAFFLAYEKLYAKLKNGDKLVWKNDYDIASFTIGITQHLDNCLYKATSKRSIPDFTEPCPWIDTFCFTPWNGQLSTSFAIHQFPENVCGLCLCFPTKIEYPIANAKHAEGIVFNSELDDYEVYETLLSNIKAMTKPLRVEINGKLHRTAVRISNAAKKDFSNFYFVTANDVKVIG